MAIRRQYDCKDKPTVIRHDLHRGVYPTIVRFIVLIKGVK